MRGHYQTLSVPDNRIDIYDYWRLRQSIGDWPQNFIQVRSKPYQSRSRRSRNYHHRATPAFTPRLFALQMT